MTAYMYPISLAVLSGFVMLLERLFPWRPEQKQLRPKLWSDFIHLVFNGHFLGLLLAGLASVWVLPYVDRWLAAEGLTDAVYRNAAADWPLWVQIIVALVVLDFVQWCVHNLLHRIPLLWEFHKAHHSVVDGEMDWIVSFRFSWLEVIVYRTVLYLPLVFFGFRWEALMFHAIFGTLIGHLNHANLNLGHGWWRYILNSPRMHIWHHDYEGDSRTTVNFGIIFSCWDWIFGTAKMPPDPPAHLGFAGVETFPDNFFSQEIWPLQKIAPGVKSVAFWTIVGALVMAAAWYLSKPRSSGPETPMLGEAAAASQPTGVFPPDDAYSESPAAAEAALADFGKHAAAKGYAHADAMVSVAELAKALGAPSLALLDVRPETRFALGHIPGARRLYRSDYSSSDDVPGMSRSSDELEHLLRKLGVRSDSTIVVYGDGGPEPYRLWWTLRTEAGFDTRVLDGGLQAWKAAGHLVAGGDGLGTTAGDVSLGAPSSMAATHWTDISKFMASHADARLIDTRSDIEFTGEEKHPKAEKAGRIPGASHLDWVEVLRDKDGDHRLKSPSALRELFAAHDLEAGMPVVTYCQSGTRSAAVYYALYQVGFAVDEVLNYDGSWAEYTRLDLPVER
jgi:3-mercaptopyruvate sulfurtransferase SseA/sterol desaturase/sphingolipid hydroxylase (fatty acid hydroxylase superfamily)